MSDLQLTIETLLEAHCCDERADSEAIDEATRVATLDE